MNTSFYNGLSGIKSYQYGLDINANNISNVNTIGFKSSSPEFSSQFETVLADSYFNSTINDLGNGSKMSATTLDMSQGIFQFTDNTFDLAIDGEGWFGLQSTNNETLYTRAGAFSVDANGNMVDPSGNYLLGTSGKNITPTTLSPEEMEEFGKYYSKDSIKLGEANQISSVNDIPLDSVENQTTINLPDMLYFPAEATTEVKYSANLDPKIIVDTTQIDLNSADINDTIDNKTITINGTVSNTPELQNPQESDAVLVTITDINGKTVETQTTLDSNLNWIINSEDISSLDTTDPSTIVTTAKLIVTQEIPNIEHFTSTIISPEGKKDILDMTYTKRVPQQSSENIWNGVIQILSFYETYDPNKTYDSNTYKVDKTAKKVYEIIDKQDTVVEFASNGALLNSSVPTMSNSGTDLTINIGEPNTFTGFVSNTSFEGDKNETHNGYLSGSLEEYSMDTKGNVIASFSNGRSSAVAKVAVYHFQNDQGLEAVGSSKFSQTVNSGKAIFYTDENNNNIQGSKVFANRLESSNVNLGTALTELIIMQKAFDASSKSITTSDQMIQNAINMKR